MSNLNNRKRPTLKERRKTLRGEDEISESHLDNIKYIKDQEELDRDIENNQDMQMFNMQNSFKPGMLLKQ